MNFTKQRAAAVLSDAAAIFVLDTLIARMRHRALAGEQPGAAARHPWLMAVAVEVAAQFGDALVYQRRRAAAAIDRAVASQHLPPTAATAVPTAQATSLPTPQRTSLPSPQGTSLPTPRAVADGHPLPKSAGTAES